MTKHQAFQAMKEGKCVAHRFFHPSEFIYMKGDWIYDEDGYSCSSEKWWDSRQDLDWEFDWEIVDTVTVYD